MSGKRARLPGADELFRTTGSGDDPAGPQTEPDPAPVPGDVDRRAMTALLEAVIEEDEVQAAVRGELGPGAPSATLGALLGWLAAQTGASHVVQVGRGGALLGTWLLRGMRSGGVLTSITRDRDDHALARSAFDEHGGSGRVRAILGDPAEVLSRLSDDAYDLLVWSAAVERPVEAADDARRLLRDGAVLVVTHLASDGGADEAGRRALVGALVDGDGWDVTVVPADGGYALARRV